MDYQLSLYSFDKFFINPLNANTRNKNKILIWISEIFLSKNIFKILINEVVENVKISLFQKYGDIINKSEYFIMCLPPGMTIETSKKLESV